MTSIPFLPALFPLFVMLFLSSEINAQSTLNFLPSKDNTIYSESANSNALGNLYAGRTGPIVGGATRRALIRFELSSIPPGSIIQAVELTLTKNRGTTSGNATLHKVTADWGEGTSFDDPGTTGGQGGGDGAPATTGDATWLHRFFSTTNWTTNGGDFLAGSSASTSISNTNGAYSWSSMGMIADVQSWVNNPTTNFGWILLGNESTTSTAARYNSSESSSGKPTLEVTYCSGKVDVTGMLNSGTHQAVEICSNAIVNSTATVFFKAINSVTLQSDFTVNQNGFFEISFDGCQ